VGVPSPPDPTPKNRLLGAEAPEEDLVQTFREGEIVWLAMVPQMEGAPPEGSVWFWPGAVVEAEVEVGYCGASQPALAFHVYTIQLLATAIASRAYHWDIIPYLGHSPFAELNRLAVRYEALPMPRLQAIMEKWRDAVHLLETTLASGRNSIQLEDVMPLYLTAVGASANIALSHAPEFPCLVESAVAPPIDHNVYRGLWLGPERIWTSDLVRLKAKRSQFPKEMQRGFLPPETESLGRRCGLFMHIRAIHEAGESSSGFSQVTGVLYEAVNCDTPCDQAELDASKFSSEDVELPPPPPCSAWKAVLDNSSHASIPAALIAGRCYSQLVSHPRMQINAASVVGHGANEGLGGEGSPMSTTLSLIGLERGSLCQTRCTCRMGPRSEVIREALATANDRVQGWIKRLKTMSP
jgi:Transcription-silencing protein Clr2